MAAIDKAAIMWSIAIVAVGVGIAMYGSQAGHTTTTMPTPQASTIQEKVAVPTTQTKPMNDPSAGVAQKVKDETASTGTEVKVDEKMTMPEATTPAAPTSVNVEIPTGTSSPGCEQTKSCYNPSSVTIAKGGKVTWKNIDTAAHTITAGSPTDGPSGVFDSSLVMGGNSFEFTFNDSGSYNYFCMVHPWMTGSVTVN